MSESVRPSLRPYIERLTATNAHFVLEDWTTVSGGVSLEVVAGQKSRLSRKRRRWITPLMRALAGLTAPVEGSCRVNGLDIAEFSFEEFNPYRASIGFGFNTPNLLNNRTLRENLSLPVLYHWEKTPTDARALISEVAEFFVISSFLDLRPANVPIGICKIVSVVRAFMRSPQFVLLDDPFVGLEHASQELLVTWLMQMLRSQPGVAL